MRIYAGTSGYSFKEWRGSFYPEDLAQDQWLTYYADQLPVVEINNTFYRMPKAHVVEAWRDAVHDEFKFIIKASRRITHIGRLKNIDEPLGYLLQRVELLGDKLGAVLFQLPPNAALNLERLTTFQSKLPDDLPVAFEFRHPSWYTPEVYEALQQHKHALVVSHDEDQPPAAQIPENSLVYLRLRAESYNSRDLQGWLKKLRASNCENAFVFFKHEDAGAGPALAAKFLALSNKPAAKRAPKRVAKKSKTDTRSSTKASTRSSTRSSTRALPIRAGKKTSKKGSVKNSA